MGWPAGLLVHNFGEGSSYKVMGAQFFLFFFVLKINLLKKNKNWSRGAQAPPVFVPVRMKIENRDNSLSFLFIGGKI